MLKTDILNILIEEFLSYTQKGFSNGEDFIIINCWGDIEDFMYEVLKLVCNEEVIQKYYGDEIEYGNLRIGRIVNGKERSPYEVPDEITKALQDAGIVDGDVNNPELSDIIGAEWGFSDEFSICDCCREVVRTSPDSYSWTKNYAIIGCEIFCGDCIRNNEDLSREYLNNNLLNNSNTANTILDPSYFEELGYQRYNGKFAAGLHLDRNYSDPEEDLDKLSKLYDNVLFDITDVSQFETKWNVWVKYRKDDVEVA